MVGAKPHPVFAQVGARRLIETFDILGNFLPLQHADRLDQLVGDAARNAGDVLGSSEREQRREQPLDVVDEPEIKPRLYRFARCTGELLVGDDAEPRAEHVLAGDQLADRRTGPAHRAVGRQHELAIGRLRELGGAGVDLTGQRRTCGTLQGLGLGAGG